MVYKNFRVQLIGRVGLLSLTLFVLFYLLFQTEFRVSPVMIGLIFIAQVVSLIHFLEKTNRDLRRFLEAIQYSDFSQTFQVEGLGASYDELRQQFNKVIEDFQKVRSEREENRYYLLNIIQHIGISLISYRDDGQVDLINNAAKKLFKMTDLKNIRNLRNFSPKLLEILQTIEPGQRQLLKVTDHDEILNLAIYITEFRLRDQLIRLVTLQNIQYELEEQEMEAWQKLIRVLTHEIMNSINPISSLSSTADMMVNDLSGRLIDSDCDEEDKETLDDIKKALATIRKRSSGLTHFVNNYRDLTRIPKPNFTYFPLREMFQQIGHLFEQELADKSITLTTNADPETLEVTADRELIEQVLINLIKNAAQALVNTSDARIELNAGLNRFSRVTIQVIDNGPGIDGEVMDKIFIPFFTTKVEGSGIGLSLSKQIMRLHRGSIAVTSKPGVRTCFTLTF